jgi:hypothetical protein
MRRPRVSVGPRRNVPLGAQGLVCLGTNPESLMSALGQKRTFRKVRAMSALPPKADIETGSLAIFAAILRASSVVSNLAADRRPGSSSKSTYASAGPLWSRATKHASKFDRPGRRKAASRHLRRSHSAQIKTTSTISMATICGAFSRKVAQASVAVIAPP